MIRVRGVSIKLDMERLIPQSLGCLQQKLRVLANKKHSFLKEKHSLTSNLLVRISTGIPNNILVTNTTVVVMGERLFAAFE